MKTILIELGLKEKCMVFLLGKTKKSSIAIGNYGLFFQQGIALRKWLADIFSKQAS